MLLGGLLGLSFAGCGQGPIPLGAPWDAGTVDGGGGRPTNVDTDGDGVCDSTEVSRGTDPSNPDTDGDTFPDGVELRLGFNPTRTDSPDRSLLVYLPESPLGTSDMPITVSVRGSGETYIGGFQTLPFTDPGMETASTFYSSASAVAANPMQNVGEVLADQQRFVAVQGRTDLYYDVRFTVPQMEELRGCQHPFPWRYKVKRDDGTLIFLRRYVLIVTPAGQRPETAAWCAPVGSCF